jgi:crotonobetainyl-CoA hydratase
LVVPAADVLKSAIQWAERILQLSPLAVRVSKRCALDGLKEPSVAAAIAAQRDNPRVRQLMQSEDRIEGARAFAQGRLPVWRNT